MDEFWKFLQQRLTETSSDVASLLAWIDALNYILDDSKSLLMTGSLFVTSEEIIKP